MNYPDFWTIQSTKGVTKGVSFPSTGWLPLCFTLTKDSLQLKAPTKQKNHRSRWGSPWSFTLLQKKLLGKWCNHISNGFPTWRFFFLEGGGWFKKPTSQQQPFAKHPLGFFSPLWPLGPFRSKGEGWPHRPWASRSRCSHCGIAQRELGHLGSV